MNPEDIERTNSIGSPVEPETHQQPGQEPNTAEKQTTPQGGEGAEEGAAEAGATPGGGTPPGGAAPEGAPGEGTPPGGAAAEGDAPPGATPSPAAQESEAPPEADLDFGESFEIDQKERNAEWRKLGTMEFEPAKNKRSEFGRIGPDARTLMKNRDLEDIHMTPRMTMEYNSDSLKFALDADGVPLQLRGEDQYPIGVGLLTPEEEACLTEENPAVLTPFRRTRLQQWHWEVSHRRTDPSSSANWCSYVFLCGDAPGQPLDSEEWPGTQYLEELRNPPREGTTEAGSIKRAAKEESKGQLEFKKTAFQLITKETNGRVSKENALILASLWGYVPSEYDKKRFLEKKTAAGLTYAEFQQWLTRSVSHPEDRNTSEIIAAFASLDFNKTGLISEFALMNLLSEYGEPLTEEDIKTVIQKTASSPKDGLVNYSEFIEELWSQNRKLPLPNAYTQLGVATRLLPPMVETEVAIF